MRGRPCGEGRRSGSQQEASGIEGVRLEPPRTCIIESPHVSIWSSMHSSAAAMKPACMGERMSALLSKLRRDIGARGVGGRAGGERGGIGG